MLKLSKCIYKEKEKSYSNFRDLPKSPSFMMNFHKNKKGRGPLEHNPDAEKISDLLFTSFIWQELNENCEHYPGRRLCSTVAIVQYCGGIKSKVLSLLGGTISTWEGV